MSLESFDKMTRHEWKQYITATILADIEAMKRALLIVYNNQTLSEQHAGTSLESNGTGFDRNDVRELSEIAKKVERGHKLSAREVDYVQWKLPKYWRQIMEKAKKNLASWKSIEKDGEDGSWKRVEIVRYPTKEDWKRCKMLALITMGIYDSNPDVTEGWKHKILQAEHSPIRTLMFTIMVRLPYYSSVHFVRHKFGVEHYVGSQRNDRQHNCDRREAPQGTEVVHVFDINAQELMSMARRRLCGKADVETRRFMALICSEVIKVCPEFTPFLVPMCTYRGGCPEMKPCGADIPRIGETVEQLALDV